MLCDKVIEVALREVGYLEKSWSAYKANPNIINDKSKGAGSDNITKYGIDMHKIYPATMDLYSAWCDAFVDWCFYQAYGVATAKSLLGGGFDDYTVASAQLYKNIGAYHKGTDGIKPGDQIFFQNGSRICHTGLVVVTDSSTIFTVEGNTSPQKKDAVEANGGGVWTKEYSYSNSRIDGYGRPPYQKYEPKATYPCWIKSGDDWYYRVSEGKNAHGWQQINGHWYYFEKDGKMVKGIKDIDSDAFGTERYYFIDYGDYEGALCKTNNRGALILWDI